MDRHYHLRDIGTERLSWAEFQTMIKYSPPMPSSALYRARFPNSWHWTPEMDLLAVAIYTLQGANWQRGGGKGDKPTLIAPPREADQNEQETDSEGFDLTDIRAELERRRHRAPSADQ